MPSVDNVQDIEPLDQYTASGGQTVFPYTFPIFEDDNLAVYDNDVLQALSADYAVSGEGNDNGGNITFTSGRTAGHIITIYRDVPIERTTDIQQNGPRSSASMNDELDRMTMWMQQLRRDLGRAVRMSLLNNQPSSELELSPSSAWAERYLFVNSDGELEPAAAIALTTLTQSIIGALLYPQTAAESGAAVTPTNFAYPPLYLRRYGGAPGSGDNSAAMNSAIAVAVQGGGGIIVLDTPGEWRMNVTIAADNIKIQMPEGRPEFDVNCIRPFNIATGPALTFGSGSADYRYCGLINCSVSGTDGTPGADVQSAKSASHCLLLKGGMVSFLSLNSYFYNGIRTVSLEPSATNPVTGVRFIGGGARNDLTDSDDARTIYGKRLVDPGFYTDNVYSNFKLNGPGAAGSTTRGYLAEFDGTAISMAAEFDYCYADFKADFASPTTVCHGVLLKGAAVIWCDGLTLDPGANGVPIIETDLALTDVGRLIVGNLRQGAQRVKFAGGVLVDLPAEADTFSFKHRLYTPTLVGARSLTIHGAANQYPTSVQWELQSTTGPERLTGADLEVMEAIRVWGGNAALSGIITAVGAGGGLFLSAQGTNQNVRLVPSGIGVVSSDATLQPTTDNTALCGSASNRWTEVFAVAGTINTSDERAKQDIEAIPQSWLDAWAEVEWTRYRFRDAVKLKGDGARWHVGLVAQRVVEVFTRHGLDALAIGIVCYDKWEGGDRYGIRYSEALALEAAYVRSRLATSSTMSGA